MAITSLKKGHQNNLQIFSILGFPSQSKFLAMPVPYRNNTNPRRGKADKAIQKLTMNQFRKSFLR